MSTVNDKLDRLLRETRAISGALGVPTSRDPEAPDVEDLTDAASDLREIADRLGVPRADRAPLSWVVGELRDRLDKPPEDEGDVALRALARRLGVEGAETMTTEGVADAVEATTRDPVLAVRDLGESVRELARDLGLAPAASAPVAEVLEAVRSRVLDVAPSPDQSDRVEAEAFRRLVERVGVAIETRDPADMGDRVERALREAGEVSGWREATSEIASRLGVSVAEDAAIGVDMTRIVEAVEARLAPSSERPVANDVPATGEGDLWWAESLLDEISQVLGVLVTDDPATQRREVLERARQLAKAPAGSTAAGRLRVIAAELGANYADLTSADAARAAVRAAVERGVAARPSDVRAALDELARDVGIPEDQREGDARDLHELIVSRAYEMARGAEVAAYREIGSELWADVPSGEDVALRDRVLARAREWTVVLRHLAEVAGVPSDAHERDLAGLCDAIASALDVRGGSAGSLVVDAGPVRKRLLEAIGLLTPRGVTTEQKELDLGQLSELVADLVRVRCSGSLLVAQDLLEDLARVLGIPETAASDASPAELRDLLLARAEALAGGDDGAIAEVARELGTEETDRRRVLDLLRDRLRNPLPRREGERAALLEVSGALGIREHVERRQVLEELRHAVLDHARAIVGGYRGAVVRFAGFVGIDVGEDDPVEGVAERVAERLAGADESALARVAEAAEVEPTERALLDWVVETRSWCASAGSTLARLYPPHAEGCPVEYDEVERGLSALSDEVLGVVRRLAHGDAELEEIDDVIGPQRTFLDLVRIALDAAEQEGYDNATEGRTEAKPFEIARHVHAELVRLGHLSGDWYDLDPLVQEDAARAVRLALGDPS